MDASSFIRDLEQEIALAESELAIKKKLLAEWKLKLGINEQSTVSTNNTGQTIASTPATKSISDSGVIDLSSFLDEAKKKPAFIDSIKEIVERFGDQEFTVQHVDHVYKLNNGIPAIDNSNRTKISTALSKLKDAGVLKMTFKGGGNVPHKYVLCGNEVQKDTDDLV